MKKEKIFLMIMMVVSMLMFTSTVFAAEEKEKTCTAMQLGELREIASNVKVTYVPKTKIEQTGADTETGATSYTSRFIDIKIYNMHSKIFVEAKNDAVFLRHTN